MLTEPNRQIRLELTFSINAIVPAGAPRYYGDEFFMEKCVKKAGFACAAWVIYNENMDYLHCSDLGWSGRKRCPKK